MPDSLGRDEDIVPGEESYTKCKKCCAVFVKARNGWKTGDTLGMTIRVELDMMTGWTFYFGPMNRCSLFGGRKGVMPNGGIYSAAEHIAKARQTA